MTLLTSRVFLLFFFFFFNDTATTEIYTLSLHDALPIYQRLDAGGHGAAHAGQREHGQAEVQRRRSEEHTSELQSPDHLVCRLLLEKKKKFRTDELNSETYQCGELWHVSVTHRVSSRTST